MVTENNTRRFLPQKRTAKGFENGVYWILGVVMLCGRKGCAKFFYIPARMGFMLWNARAFLAVFRKVAARKKLFSTLRKQSPPIRKR